MTPPWLDQHIRTVTGAPPGARNAKPQRCPKCKTLTLIGLDNDWAALDTRADPTPISYQGEALAQLAGRLTYALRRRGNRLQLVRRDRWQIPAQRNWPTPYDVIAAHQCGAPPLPEIESVYRPSRKEEINECPF